MRTIARMLALVLAVGLTACGGRATMDGADDDAPAVLEVENHANLDMTIYAIREGGERRRLGTATAHLTTEFTIPASMMFGLTSFRFQADPIGGDRAPVTHSITVAPGDRVVMRIPPG